MQKSTKILVPFADNKDKFYGFNFGSGHKNIKNQDGTWWTVTRAELEALAA